MSPGSSSASDNGGGNSKRLLDIAVAKETAPTRTGDADWEDNSPRGSAVKNLSLRGGGPPAEPVINHQDRSTFVLRLVRRRIMAKE